MENLIANYRLQLLEFRSCITVLQQAVQNGSEEIKLLDIDNYLEIIMEKINHIIEDFEYTLNKEDLTKITKIEKHI